jgi:1,4-dihydroxy-2-naphthoate octaprenyltransferase
MGFWSVAVLNLNNMRDVNSDQAAGKFTVPIFLGYTNARIYQTILVVGGMVSLIFFGILTEQLPMILGAFPGIAIMTMALVKTWKVKDPVLLDPFLKPQALGTFLAVSGMFLVAIL